MHADLYAVDVNKMKKKPSRIVAPNSRKVPTFTLLPPYNLVNYYGFLLVICVVSGQSWDKRVNLCLKV